MRAELQARLSLHDAHIPPERLQMSDISETSILTGRRPLQNAMKVLENMRRGSTRMAMNHIRDHSVALST
jgi:hypothetical protein